MQDFTYYLFIIAAIYQNILLEYVGSTDFHRFLENDMQYSGPQLLHLYKLKFFVLWLQNFLISLNISPPPLSNFCVNLSWLLALFNLLIEYFHCMWAFRCKINSSPSLGLPAACQTPNQNLLSACYGFTYSFQPKIPFDFSFATPPDFARHNFAALSIA